MKKWLFCIVIILVIALIAALAQVKYANQQWKDAMVNVKAYSQELSDAKDKSTAYKLTIDQLEYFQDSIMVALNETREELKVKDKNLKVLQYVASNFSKRDTIRIADTLFKEPTLNIDTLIGDKWCSIKMGLRYPSTIIVNPKFTSEKHIVVSLRKETVNPPKKFFLCRWLQKKQKVLQVNVIEKNPYIDEQSSKYIEIIK